MVNIVITKPAKALVLDDVVPIDRLLVEFPIIYMKSNSWFWDDNVNHKRIYKLAGINKKAAYPFENTTGGVSRHCQPVRKDEVTFYEDKRDD